jgi:phage shock protein PspC (stress-responsive transcriptional regulator)
MATLARPATGFGAHKGKLGGVCAALGERFGIDPRWIRLGFLASMLLPGPQILLYAFLWWLIPEAQ